MPNGSEALDFEAVLKTTDFKKEIQNLKNEIRGFVSTSVSETKKIDDTFSKLSKVAAGAFAFTQLSDLPSKIIQVRGEFQNLEIAFSTMLNSKSAADKLLGEITQFAAKTPFTLTEVATGAKQLLAYGSSVKSVVSEIRMLGDVSAGVSAPIGDLIYLYGTLRTQGRAYAVDIRQFASRGIPIYEELAKVLKINTSEVNAFVESGKVGFKEVEQVFKNMTAAGGLFDGLTEKTAKSLTGLMSNFKDAVDRAFNDIGKSQEGLLASGILTATELVNNYEKVLDILTVIVATYGAYRAALIVTAAAETLVNSSKAATLYLEIARSVGVVTTAHRLNAVTIGIETQAQAALNAVMNANPYVLATTLIVGLVAVLYTLHDSTTAAQLATENLNKIEEDSAKIKSDLTAKTNELVSTIRSETSTRLSQIESYRKLQELYPSLFNNMDLDTYKKLDATQAQKELNKAIDASDTKRLEQNYTNANKRVEALKKNIASLTEALSLSGNQGSGVKGDLEGAKKALEAAKIEAQKLGEAVAKRKQDEYEANTPIQEQLKHYEDVRTTLESKSKALQEIIAKEKAINQGAETMKSIFANITLQNVNTELSDVLTKLAKLNGNGSTTVVTNKGYYENIKKTNQDLLDGLAYNQRGSAEWRKYSAAIADADKHLQAWGVTSKRVTKKKEEVIVPDSIRYYEKIVENAQKAIESTPSTNTAALEKQLKIKTDAEQNIERIRLGITKRSFDDEIKYKQEQYELYSKWVEYYGKATADNQFKDLLKSGETYKAFLESQIADLQGKVDNGTATTQDKNNLVSLKSSLAVDSSSLDVYKNKIVSIRDEVGTLTEYIQALKTEQSTIATNDKDKAEFIIKEIIDAEKQRKQLLKDFLIENNVGNAQRIAIQKKYNDLRTALDEQYLNNKDAAYQESLKKLNETEQKDLAEQAADNLQKNSKVYQELTKIVKGENRKQLLNFIESKKAELAVLESNGAKDSNAYKELQKVVTDAKKELLSGDIQALNEVYSIIGQIGGEFESIKGVVGQIWALLKNISSYGSQVSSVLSGQMSEAQALMSVAQTVSGVLNTILRNREGNKVFEDNYNKYRIAQQNQYLLLLNQEIRLKTLNNSNIFVKNYKGIVADGIKALENAQDIYEKNLAALTDAKVKDGIKKVLDAKEGLAAALGLGVVGALATSLFGKKAEDVFKPLLETYPDIIKTLSDGTKEFDVLLAQTLINSNQVDENTKVLLQNTIDSVKAIEDAKKQITEVIADLTGQLGSTLRDNLVNAFKDGTDAAVAWGDSVGSILENIISQTLFSSVFSKAFENLQKDFEASFAANGDGKLTDDLVKFYQQYPDLAKTFTEGLATAQKEAEKLGLPIFKSNNGQSNSALSGITKGITEETAGIVAGQMNAIRINQATMIKLVNQQLVALNNISDNSNYLKRLESIDNKLSKNSLADELRAGGL